MNDAAAVARLATEPEAFAVEPAAEATPQAKILLVDDEPKSLFALQELLSTLGQNLMIAQSGEEALRLALKNDFAVILLDVRMPGIDGFETARLIRSRERSRLTPIIFLTAAADEMSSMFRGYEVGAVDYLQKPVVPEILKSKVAVFVELHRKSERLRESEEKLRRLAAHLISVREEARAQLPPEGLKLDVDISTTMFRIFQEILTNVARHSRATRVDMELAVGEDRVSLEVVDNGVGIADADLNGKKSLGLLGMHERALL